MTDNTIKTTTGDYEIKYETNDTDESVRWTIAVKGEEQLTSKTDNFEEAIKETTELTKTNKDLEM